MWHGPCKERSTDTPVPGPMARHMLWTSVIASPTSNRPFRPIAATSPTLGRIPPADLPRRCLRPNPSQQSGTLSDVEGDMANRNILATGILAAVYGLALSLAATSVALAQATPTAITS